MSMINSFGIGAGAAISRQVSDDEELNRQELRRKRKVEYAAEQEFARRLAAERVHQPTLASAAVPQWQTPFGASTHRNLSSHAQGRKKYDASQSPVKSSEVSKAHHLSEHEPMTQTAVEAVSSEKDELMSPPPLDVAQRLALIIEDLSGASVKAKAERVLPQLEDLMTRFRSEDTVITSTEEIDEASSYLEFLSGYFEVDQGTHAPSRKIVDTVQGLQEQMTQIAETLKIAVSGQLPAHLQPSLQSASIRSLYLQKSTPDTFKTSEKKSNHNNVDHDEEASDVATLASLTSAVNPPIHRPGSRNRDQSSQERDTDKRKDETLVGITLRSV